MPKVKNKVIVLTRDELGGKMMKEFAALRAETYSYITDINDEDKKAKGTIKCLKKEILYLKIIKPLKLKTK